MVKREDIVKLVEAHATIEDDPMDAAIWIRRDDDDAWLVEVLPALRGDDAPGEPVTFRASRSFHHALHLIASDAAGLERAIRGDQALAHEIAAGEVLYELESRLGQRLQSIANEVTHGHARAG